MIESPSGWIVSTLGTCCSIVSGGTPKRERPEYWGGSIPWVTPKDISDLDCPDFYEPPEKITELGLRKSSAALLPAGAVLLSSRAPIGLLAIAGEPMATNQGFKSLIPGPELDSRFLYYALKRLVPLIQERGNGATFKEVSKSIVSEIPISYPRNLQQQKRIAAILDKADGIRRKQESALAMSDDLLKSVFLRMFCGQAWTTKPLSDVVKPGTIVTYGIVQAGPEYPGGVPYIRTGDIKNGEIVTEGLLHTAPKLAEKFARSRVESGEIVMSIRATVGTTAFVPPSLHGANLTQGTARISPGPETTKEYLISFLRSASCQQWIGRQIKGATFREITLSRLRELKVPLPPIDLQRAYSKIYRSATEIVVQQRNSKSEADILYSSLSQHAFRGRL